MSFNVPLGSFDFHVIRLTTPRHKSQNEKISTYKTTKHQSCLIVIEITQTGLSVQGIESFIIYDH